MVELKENDVVVFKKSIYEYLDEGGLGVIESIVKLIGGKVYMVDVNDSLTLVFYPHEIEKIGEL